MGQTQYADQNWTTNIQGVTPNYPPITNWRIAAGRDRVICSRPKKQKD